MKISKVSSKAMLLGVAAAAVMGTASASVDVGSAQTQAYTMAKIFGTVVADQQLPECSVKSSSILDE